MFGRFLKCHVRKNDPTGVGGWLKMFAVFRDHWRSIPFKLVKCSLNYRKTQAIWLACPLSRRALTPYRLDNSRKLEWNSHSQKKLFNEKRNRNKVLCKCNWRVILEINVTTFSISFLEHYETQLWKYSRNQKFEIPIDLQSISKIFKQFASVTLILFCGLISSTRLICY